MIALAREQGVDFAVVTPDDPLSLGMVDAMEEAGIAAFGPNRAAAVIESSKVFAKELMEKYIIPTPTHRSFCELEDALGYVRSQEAFPVVIKADGLALGKGVVIAGDLNSAEMALRRMMAEKVFGKSGERVVIEEFLTGPEVSVLAFCDGKTVIPMVSSMDHKRAFDGDRGPNTGGMGAIAPNPHYTPEMAGRCMRDIFLPTLLAMKKEGRPFKGCLYFGLILTEKGPMVIEYNCRFGDPETQAVLPLLKSDLLEIMLAARNGRLGGLPIAWSDEFSACVVLASGGYPGGYEKGYPIYGLKEAEALPAVTIYHAGTGLEGDKLITAGGRVLGVTSIAATLKEAVNSAYSAVGLLSFEGMSFRRDIGGR
jgi:phosphoribosylamine--glycine ligase